MGSTFEGLLDRNPSSLTCSNLSSRYQLQHHHHQQDQPSESSSSPPLVEETMKKVMEWYRPSITDGIDINHLIIREVDPPPPSPHYSSPSPTSNPNYNSQLSGNVDNGGSSSNGSDDNGSEGEEGKKEFTLTLFDFAGQEIYYNTRIHFFLCRDSIYLFIFQYNSKYKHESIISTLDSYYSL